MKVPDGIEPAVGYRVWEVRNDRLYSLRHHEVWVPFEEFHAKCQKDATHKPPVESCTCGLYAAATFNRLFDMGYTKQGGLFSGQPDDIVIAINTATRASATPVKMKSLLLPFTAFSS